MHTLKLFSIYGKNLRSKISMIIGTLVFLLFFTFLPSFAATVTYDYDALNRLQTVNYGNGFRETYTYDGTGNRISLTRADVVPPTVGINSDHIFLSSSGNATLTGTAGDLGDGVQSLEISLDGGLTWHTAMTTDNWATWFYTWATHTGSFTILLRVTDGTNTHTQSFYIIIAPDPLPHNPDLLFRNPVTGENVAYYMNGVNIIGGVYLPTIDPAWVLAGIADLNGDGKPDLLWRNPSTGENVAYYMNGVNIISGVNLPTIDPAWTLAGTADLNDDGKPDLLWRNPVTGENVVYYMNGVTILSGVYLPTIDPAWTLAGTADLNDDGKPDLLWRNPVTGENVVYYMNGVTILSGAYLPTIDPARRLVGTGDFNGDNKPDFLFRNPVTGENAVYYMNGVNIIGGVYLSPVDPAWDLVGTGDFNGDGN
jgi:YD repeat-containing protein